MARTAITVQTLGFSNTTPTYAAADAANGNYFVHPGGTVLVHVKNTNAATRNLTFTTTATVDGIALASTVFTIPATTGDKMICKIPDRIATGGQIYLDWSADTNVTIAVFSVPG